MTNTKDLRTVAFNNALAAQDAFRSINSEALASFQSDAVADALLAHVRLKHQAELVSNSGDFSFLVDLLERSFLGLYDRGVLVPSSPLTARGEQALEAMRARTGIGYIAPATEEEIAQSAEADLEAEVIHDWEHLSSDAVKKKMSANPAYRAAFNRLSETDAIGGTSTMYTRIAGAPDGNQYGRR